MNNTKESKVDIFNEKYNKYSSMLFKLSMPYLGNRSDAEDAVQEAFIRLMFKAPVFVDEEHEKRWLLRITINICKDKLKGFWRRHSVSLEDDYLFTDCDTEILNFAQMIVKLPIKYKDVIHLYYYENYKVPEIAEILHLSISAVKMRLKRGREILKIELEAEL